MRAKDYCRKCSAYISIVYADKKCPKCKVSNPVKPIGFFEQLFGTILILGFGFGFIFFVGLILIVWFVVMLNLTG
tara:strand:- start:78 stop:302 length:225 start_codon:yes stop_codon:yes gene_type:complete